MAIEADMSARQKIDRAIVEITSESPFFSYLVLNAEFEEDPSLPALAGVLPTGKGVFNPDMINPPEETGEDPVPVDQVKGLVVHETLHLAFQHPWIQYPDHWEEEIKNMAQEIEINATIKAETNYDLPPSDFVPENGDDFKIPINQERTEHVEIKNATEKDVFEIYEEIKEQMEDKDEDDFDIPNSIPQEGSGQSTGGGGQQAPSDGDNESTGGGGNEEDDEGEEEQTADGGDEGEDEEEEEQPTGGGDSEDNEEEEQSAGDEGDYDINKQTGFDIHSQGDKEDAEDEGSVDKDSWDEALSKAIQESVQAGHKPSGVEEKIEELMGHDFNWRDELDQYVKEQIPRGFTYQRPSPTSRVVGVYMPDVRYEETIDIIVGIDSSGSVSSTLLGQFKGDMISIARSYDQVNMKVLSHDTEVHDEWEMRNGQIEQLEEWNPVGRGGTDLRSVFDYVDEKHYNPDLIIEFTDGMGERPQSIRYPTLWVLAGNHVDPEAVETGRVIVAREGDR